MRVINFYRKLADNIGDVSSAPLLYFNVDVEYHLSELMKCEEAKILPQDILIIGGGGLINNNFFSNQLDFLMSKKNKIIFWGVGDNQHYDRKPFLNERKIIERSFVYGSRSSINPVFCPSCMSKDFNGESNILYDFVIYTNTRDMIVVDGIKSMTNHNDCSLKEKIDFLKSGNCVITNTYHGLYWALLLNKFVICVPFSTKFDYFKNNRNVMFLNKNDDIKKVIKNTRYKQKNVGFLDRCRETNKKFFKLVLNKISEIKEKG